MIKIKDYSHRKVNMYDYKKIFMIEKRIYTYEPEHDYIYQRISFKQPNHTCYNRKAKMVVRYLSLVYDESITYAKD